MFSQALSLLLQLSFLSLAYAAPVAEATGNNHNHGNTWQYGTGGGVVGFIILILDIIVFLEVLKSGRPVLHKVLWCALVFLFPVGGLIIYWLFSNRAAHNTGSGYETIA